MISGALESRFVKSADGTEIYTDAAGNRSPNAPTIILIPGFSMAKAAFDAIFEDPKWTSYAFLVRYDTRGSGKSGKPLNDEAWESSRLSEDFEAVCKEFNVTKAFVLGWSYGASHFVDIISHNTTVTINGFINVEGPPYVDPTLTARLFVPESAVMVAGLMQTTDVDAFQIASLNFVSLLSNNISPELYRALLEGIIVMPRAIATRLASRSHNMDVMHQKARDGQLELLLVTGGKDEVINGKEVEAVLIEKEWKHRYHHLEEADHMPWLSVSDQFREVVLQWVGERSA